MNVNNCLPNLLDSQKKKKEKKKAFFLTVSKKTKESPAPLFT